MQITSTPNILSHEEIFNYTASLAGIFRIAPRPALPHIEVSGNFMKNSESRLPKSYKSID